MNETPKDPALKNSIQTDVLGLVFCCPYDGSNPPECQLHDLRERPIQERLDFLKKQSYHDCLKIKSNHDYCLCKKEKRLP